MKCKNPQCDNEVIAAITGHDLCVDCYRNTSPTPLTKPYPSCAHKNCNEPRLDVSRFCNLHYDEARAVATGHGYDGVPNVTIFGNDCEEQDRKVRELESQGYVVIAQKERIVGDGVEMRFVGALQKAKTKIEECRHPAIKEAQRINAYADQKLAASSQVSFESLRQTILSSEPLTATEILRRQQENDDRLQSDIQAMQQRRSPLLDELVAKAVATGAFATDAQQGNKRADRNQFAAPRSNGKVLELSYEEHHRLVWLILAVTLCDVSTGYNDVRDILKSYGIIGGAK